MPASPLGSTHGRTTSGMACHHRLWAAQTVKRRRGRHAITALGLHARSDDVERDMTSPLLDSTHGQMTLGVACHHRLWTAHMVERRRAWHATVAIGQYKQSNDVGGSMPSPPLDYMHGRTTSGVTWLHRPWTAHTIEQCRARHDITALGRHERLDDVRHGMTLPPLDNTHG